MVGPGHCPYYANPDGTLLLDHPGQPDLVRQPNDPGPSHSRLGTPSPSPTFVACASGSLVRPPLWLAIERVFHCGAPPGRLLIYGQSPGRSRGPGLVDSLAYSRLNCAKSSSRHRYRAEIQRSKGVANLDSMNLDGIKPDFLGRKLVEPFDGGPVRRSEMRCNPYYVSCLVFSRIRD